jgi:hypothetical protein
MIRLKENFINYLTLFGSAGTLLCCALPALLVSLGLGAVMAGLAGNVPGLIWLSEKKAYVFGFAMTMLIFNGWLIWRNRNAPCPLDPKLRDACLKGRKFSRITYFVSLGIFLIGFYFAYGINFARADGPRRTVVELSVTDKGFQPGSVDVGPGQDLTLKITRKTDNTCARDIVIPSKKIKKELPLNKEVVVHVGKLEKGEVRFGCGMNLMEGGKIFVK